MVMALLSNRNLTSLVLQVQRLLLNNGVAGYWGSWVHSSKFSYGVYGAFGIDRVEAAHWWSLRATLISDAFTVGGAG